jgi:hypothetical protein
MEIEILYVRPVGDFEPFEARLHEVVRRCCEPVHLVRTSGALPSLGGERVFATCTVPNVVIVCGGEVIAQAVGDLPARELELLVQAAVARAVALREGR